MGLIPEEKAAPAVCTIRAPATHSENGPGATATTGNNTPRRRSAEGRRSSAERMGTLRTGNRSSAEKSPIRRGVPSVNAVAGNSVPDGRKYKYWLMVNWTPHVGLTIKRIFFTYILPYINVVNLFLNGLHTYNISS